MERLASKIIDAIRKETELNLILQEAVTRLGEFADADRCAIWLFDGVKQQYCGLPAEYRRPNLLRPIAETAFPEFPVMPALSLGETIVYSDVKQEAEGLTERDQQMLQERDVVGLIHVPILFHDKPLGLLRLHTKERREWNKAIVSEVENIANQLAIALYTAKLIADLKESESRKTAILDASLDAIVTIDREGLVLEWNKGAEKTFGYAYDDVIGKTMSDFIIPERYKTPHHRGIAHYLATGEGPVLGKRVELPAVRKDGTEFPTEISIVAIHQGEKVLFTATLRDISEQKEAQRALTRNENLLSDFFENASLGLHWVGPDGIILRANRAELELLGYEPDEYIGHHIAKFHADEPVIQDILTRLTCKETLIDYEARLRCKDGSIKEVLINSNVYWENEEFVHTRCFTRDITEQKRFERELRESELRFRNLADTAPMYMAMADETGSAVYFNKPWLEWTGRTMDEMEGLGWLCTLHPEDAPRFEREFKNAFTKQVSINEEYRFRRDDGEYRWMMAVGAPRFAPDGRFIGYFGTYTDFHDLKEAQLALQESKEHLQHQLDFTQAITSNLGEGIYALDSNGCVTFINPAAEKMLGWNQDELLGKNMHDAIHYQRADGSHVPAEECPLLGVLKTGEVVRNFEDLFIRKDGSPIPVYFTSTPIVTNGQITGALCAFHDITERKKAEQALKESEERYQLVIEGSNDGIWDWDHRTGIIFWNKRCYEQLGVPYDTVITPEFFQERVHPDERSRIMGDIKAHVEEGKPYSIEVRLRNESGNYGYYLARGVSVRDEHGKVIRTAGVRTDITQLKKAEKALQYQLQLTESITDNATASLFMMDVNGYATFMNPAAEEMFGYTLDEIQSKPLHYWVHHSHPDGTPYPMEECPIDRALPENNDVRAHEDVFFRKNGEPFYISCAARPLYKDGKPVGTLVEVRDITEEKHAEQTLKESEERYRLVVKATRDGTWDLDLKTNRAVWNKRFYEILGYQPEEVNDPGPGFLATVLHPDDKELMSSALSRAIQTRSDYQTEYRLKHKDGHYVTVISKGAPVLDEHGIPFRMVGTITDITEEKKVALALKESEERFRHLYTSNMLGIMYCDIHNAIYDANDALLEMIGYTRGDLEAGSLNWKKLTPSEYLGLDEKAINELKERRVFTPFEKKYIHKDGHLIDILLGGAFQEGSNEQCVLFVLDITDKKRAEKALQESKENLESSNNLLSSISRVQSRFITDEDPWILFNDFLNDILSITKSEYGYIAEVLYDDQNQPYLKFRGLTNIAWDTPTRELYENHAKAGLEFHKLGTLYGAGLTSGKTVIANDPYHDPRRGGLPSGHPALNAYMAIPIFRGKELIGQVGLANRPGGFDERLETFLLPVLITCGNLIEAYRNNELRKQSEERYQLLYGWEKKTREVLQQVRQPLEVQDIFASVVKIMAQTLHADRCFIVEFDESGNVTPVRYEYRSNESVKPFTGMCPPWDFCPYLAKTAKSQLAAAEDTWDDANVESNPEWYSFSRNYDIRGIITAPITYQGKLINVLVLHTVTPYQWTEQEIFFTQIVTDQIATSFYQTQLFRQEQKARELAEEASRKKSEFLAMMSHELRTPLNSIIGYSRMIENGMGGPLTEQQAKYIKNVGNSGGHLLNIVNDLLDVSKVEAGKMVISPGTIEVRPIIDEVQSMMLELAKKSDVYVSFQIQPDIDTIEADPSRFKQILINLTSNAIKFNKKGGSVSVRLNKSEDHKWLIGEVQDTGIGIPQEKQAELFKKFYQVDNTASRTHEGTGLGLALTKDLIELHGGEISLDSEEDVGSTFTFRLPTHIKVLDKIEQP